MVYIMTYNKHIISEVNMRLKEQWKNNRENLYSCYLIVNSMNLINWNTRLYVIFVFL